MKNNLRWYSSLFSISVVLMLLIPSSCNSEKEEDIVTKEGVFSRSLFLSEMANKLIIPNLEALQASVNTMNAATTTFIDTPNEANLQELKNFWIQAVTDFQHCSAFGFGPGSISLGSFASVLGVFPVDENQVEYNISNKKFNLAASFDRDVRGFFAVEYLLYGKDQTNAKVIAHFDQNRKDYLQLIVGELNDTFNKVVSEWKSYYLKEFTRNDVTSAGSPVSLLYNEFVKDYEILKNFKVELPAGLSAGQASPNPSMVEAYYSGISQELIDAHFESSKNIWAGLTPSGTDIIGFEEYLNSVVGGEELVVDTQSAIEAIEDAISALPSGPLSENLESQEVISLRNLMQNNTANFKSSMSSLLGISITFNSGDGD